MRPLLRSFRPALAAVLLLASAFPQPSWAQQRILLDGSTGMIPLARALAEAYQRQSPDPQVAIGQGLGTSARITALSEGRIQVALASHGLKTEELQQLKLDVLQVAKGPIVFAVNSSVPLAGITEAQACDIYGGKTRNWQALAAGSQPVVVLTRPPTEVDAEVIRAKIGCFSGLTEADHVRVMPRGGDMARALAETPDAIGMTSMTVVEQSGGRIRALTLNGVEPSAANVRSNRYLLTRDYYLVTRSDADAAIRRFLAFVLSPEGDRVILDSGAVPLR